MTDLSQRYEYQIESADKSDFIAFWVTVLFFSALPVVLSCWFDKHLLFGIPFDWHNQSVVELYAVLGAVVAVFAALTLKTLSPEPERFYFGSHGFQFEGNLASVAPSFYCPTDKVSRISLNRENVLELTDSLGNVFVLPNVQYSLQSERELSECFGQAFVWQPELAVVDGADSFVVRWQRKLANWLNDDGRLVGLVRTGFALCLLVLLVKAAMVNRFDWNELMMTVVCVYFLWATGR